MSLVLYAPCRSLLTGFKVRSVVCWRIARLDGTIFRYTEHNSELKVLVNPNLLYQSGDPYETFVPVGGVVTSARELGEDSNLEARGFISSLDISDDDLRAGLFDGAEARELLVDWRYPWVGPIIEVYWYFGVPEFSKERWNVQMHRLGEQLTAPAGGVYSADGRIKATPVHTKTSEVTTIITQRRVFRTQAGTLDTATDAYNWGTIEWTSGANQGTKSTVRQYTNVGGGAPQEFELALQTPHDISSGDDFTVTKVEYEEGFPFVPGTDAVRATPPTPLLET